MGSSSAMTKMVKSLSLSLSLRSKSMNLSPFSSSIDGSRPIVPISYRSYATHKVSAKRERAVAPETDQEEPELGDGVVSASSPTRKPLSEILSELSKRVPDSVIRTRVEDGFSMRYIPWHIVNRIMNLHAPEWSGEVRNITYSADGKSVSVVYRVTLHGTDSETHRESTGTASVEEKGYGDPVQKAEAMAFRRACARFGLGLHLYHEDLS